MGNDELTGRGSDVGSVGSDRVSRGGGSPGQPQRPTNLLSRQSMSLTGDAFAREPSCGMCHKNFNILRRRHHCRSCHTAVCKDCGRKAVDHSAVGSSTKPQWYCHPCIHDDANIEVVGGSGGRGTLSKRPSFSFTQQPPTIDSLASAARMCIECGYELPPRVKFCIECGTAVKLQIISPGPQTTTPVDPLIASRSSRSNSKQSSGNNLMIIDEQENDEQLLLERSADREDDATITTSASASTSDGMKDDDETSPPAPSEEQESGGALSTAPSEELLLQLQAENERLRRRVDKLKVKVVESEKKREDTAAHYQQALASATSQAQAQAQAPEPAQVALLPPPAVREPPSQGNGSKPSGAATSGVAVKEHPDYVKFFKLLSMGLPAEQVKMKMLQAGVDPNKLDTPDEIMGGAGPAPAEAATASAASSGGTLVKDDEKYAKFFKLLKMGMPGEQIKMKMSAEGLDPALLDTPDATMPGSGSGSGSGGGSGSGAATAMAVKDDPDYEKFFKLAKMGMPHEQIKMKMSAAGLNGDLLDTPDAPSPNQKAGGPGGSNNGLLAGLPPRAEAVKVDPSALLQASLSSKQLQRSSSAKIPEEPALPKKDAIKPNVELRPLFWTRVPVNVVKSTIWMKLDDNNASLDVDEMEWMFRKNPVLDGDKKKDDAKNKNGKDGGANAATAAPQLVLLLDPKRQQNVSIAIARFRMTASEIKDAIYALDGDKLSSELLNVLISISPTSEEQDLLKNYDGDVKLLGNVEKFFLELLTIPRYTQRIKCIRFQLTFETRILETQAQLDTLQAATDQVSDSDKFRRVLENILAIGNYLNGSTPRGGAYGFKLDTLTKLHALKSVDPRVTLMNFMLHQLEEKAPDVIAFAGELPHIGDAKRLSLDQLRADLNAYNSELVMLQAQVRASKSDKIDGDKFFTQMAPFAKDAVEVLEELGRDYGALEASYHELLTSFGEDPRKVGPMEFFAILEEFVNEFKKAYRQNQTKEYQAIYEAAKTAREEASAASRAALEQEEATRLEALEAEKRLKEEQDRVQKEAAEQATRDAEQGTTTDDARALYGKIISAISNWAAAHGSDKTLLIDQFKAVSRSYGVDEISADTFCQQVRQIVSSKMALQIIPESAKLLTNASKRKNLLIAFDKFNDQVKKEKEAKKNGGGANGMSKQPSKPKKRHLPMAIKVEDIEPVVGEAAHQLHKSILESVQQAFQGDAKKMKLFSSNARKYGAEQMSARDFYAYLTTSFDPDFVGRLVPDLARLLQDAEKRHALIRALCESAPGWEKFSGL